MSREIEIRVPDIGDFEDVEVVEILVAKGDAVAVEDSLVSIESDKATMEIPAPAAGIVQAVHISLGATVSEGTLLLTLLTEEAAATDSAAPPPTPSSKAPPPIPANPPAQPTQHSNEAPPMPTKQPAQAAAESAAESAAQPAPRSDEAPPMPTKQPAQAAAESAAESAAQPAPRSDEAPPMPTKQPAQAAAESAAESAAQPAPRSNEAPPMPTKRPAQAAAETAVHASPLVRGAARELGVDLGQTRGTGPHGRILAEDVKAHVRERMQGAGRSASPQIEDAPAVDFSRFGPTEEVPLGKVRRVAARNLSRSWLSAPHVTQHDEADVTELEAFRRRCKADAAERGLKLSPLHFVLKAVAVALRDFPDFRSSLSPGGESLIVKHYVHLGVAVDTEHGLVVPVVRDVDRKGVYELATELAELAERARARKLMPADMQGACFSLSSLGGIGGTSFTPIVNTPEVAILGLSKLDVRPLWTGSTNVVAGGDFEPRIVLPLSLSYDHRVIDGAEAARFTSRLARLLSHPANLLL